MPNTFDVPLFPLPSLLLYPGRVLPLHVFEPRYRELMRDALAGPGRMAMAVLRPGWEPNYEGRPPIFEMVSIGTIVKHRSLPDGRFFLQLRGDERGKVVEEKPGKPYRIGRVARLEEAPVDATREACVRDEIACALSAIVGRAPEFPAEMSAVQIADETLLALPLPIGRKMEIFAQCCQKTRIAAVLDAIRAIREERDELGRADRLSPDNPNLN